MAIHRNSVGCELWFAYILNGYDLNKISHNQEAFRQSLSIQGKASNSGKLTIAHFVKKGLI